MKLVSIIVPIFNSEKYLCQCVDSILAQSYSNFELLLIDDGSTDSSGKIIDEYAVNDVRVRVFHNENQGSAAARQFGFSNAEGEYVTAIDSDDWVDSNHLKNMVESAEKNSSDMVMTAFFINYDGEGDHYIQNSIIGDSVIAWQTSFLEHRVHAGLWNKLLKREVLTSSEVLVPRFNYYEDMVVTISYLNCCSKLSYVPVASYHYRIHGNSMSFNVNMERRLELLEQMLKNMQDLFNYLSVENQVRLKKSIYFSVNAEKKRLIREFPQKYNFYRRIFQQYFSQSYRIIKITGITTLFRRWSVSGRWIPKAILSCSMFCGKI